VPWAFKRAAHGAALGFSVNRVKFREHDAPAGLAYYKPIADMDFPQSESLCGTTYQGITGKSQLLLRKSGRDATAEGSESRSLQWVRKP